MSATTTSSITSSVSSFLPSITDLSNNGNNSSLGSATYYAAIGSAILVMIGVSFTSRLMYIRKARAAMILDRMELSRRGEEGGLPTYIETTAPQTLSYLHSPLSPLQPSYQGTNRFSSPVPPSHPAYAPPNVSSRFPGGRAANRTYHPSDTAAPPAYLGLPLPPKYEIGEEGDGEEEEAEGEVVGGDREAEVGGRGQEVDAEVAEANWGDVASGSGSGNASRDERMEEVDLGTVPVTHSTVVETTPVEGVERRTDGSTS